MYGMELPPSNFVLHFFAWNHKDIRDYQQVTFVMAYFGSQGVGLGTGGFGWIHLKKESLLSENAEWVSNEEWSQWKVFVVIPNHKFFMSATKVVESVSNHFFMINLHFSFFNWLSRCQGLTYLFEALLWKFLLLQPYIGWVKCSWPIRQYIPHSYCKISLFFETTVSQTQLAFLCSNSAILTVEQSVK